MLWYVLQSIDVSASPTTVSACGASSTLSTTAYFKLFTKNEDNTTSASTNTSETVTASASYSENKSYTSVSGSKITFDKNKAGDCYGADSRDSTATASYTFSGVTKTDTVTITQNANPLGNWYNTTQTTNSISISPASMSFDSAGGTQTYSVTRYYTQYEARQDSCGTVVCTNSYNTSSTVTPSDYDTTGDFECTSSSVSIGVNSGSERSGQLTVSYDGKSDSINLSQGASQAGTSSGEPYDYTYDFSVSVSPWSDLSCDGGTTYATATFTTYWKYDWEETNDAGEVINSGTSNDSSSSDVTNSTTWSTDRGSISSNGTLTYPSSTSSGTVKTTVTGVYGDYSDSDYMTQVDCSSGGGTDPDPDTGTTCTASNSWTGISVSSVSAGKCDTSASMTVTANGTHTNTDCSTAATSTTLSSSNYTVKYGTSSSSYTLDNITANETTSEVTWYYKVTASSTYGSKTATGSFKQDAGKCTADPDPDPDTGTTVTYSYSGTAEDFDDCETSTSVKVYEKASTATTWTEITSSISPTLKYKTNDTIYANSATVNTGSTSVVWSVQISFTRRNESQTVVANATQDAGPCPDACTCSVTSISVSPTEYTFTSSSDEESFTVTINDNSSTCSKCGGGFKVYDSNGLQVDSGTTSFTMTNTGGTFTIKANDDTSKTCTLTLTKYTAPADPVYVFKFNNPSSFASGSDETKLYHTLTYEESGPTTTMTSTKDGSNVGYTMSSNVSWITTSTGSTTCSWNITENTSTSEREGTITLTQDGSGNKLYIYVTQDGAAATCDCSCISISCSPTTAMTNESTTVLLTYCDNCSKGWTAYNSSGTKVDSGNSGDTFKPSSMGQYTIVSDACTAKTCTFTVYKEITLTWSGSINRILTNNESSAYGCDKNGDGDYELYLPESILFAQDDISYSISNFSGSYSDISVTVTASRFHLGSERTGTTSYTLSSSSGELKIPSCTDTVSDEICIQVEQDETITSYSASYVGTDFYKIKEIDNVEYIDI